MKRFNIDQHIVYEDQFYLAINKPAGIASLHERIGVSESVIEAAKRYNENLQLCHRLDKDTSGILLISKNAEAYRNAAIQFEKRQVKKAYHAISDGVHNFQDLIVELSLITTRSNRSAVNAQKGKKSITIFNTLENFQDYTLFECLPETGRLHQIRIHLASQNAPIAADEIYGGKQPYLSKIKRKFSISKSGKENPMIARFALHSYSLELQNVDGTKLKIEAEYAKDFAVFLKLLRKYNKTTF